MSDGQEVCLVNIGPKQRAMRLRFGLVFFLLALGALATLVAVQAPWWSRLALFVPFSLAATGYFQARRRT